MIGRTHHQQVELFVVEQRFERVIGLADRYAMFSGIGQAGRRRIHITNNRKIRPGSRKNPCQIAQPIAEANNAYSHALPVLFRDPVNRRPLSDRTAIL
ncbi:hypothetical protein FQZ97_946750 [compost metagenome]